MIHNLFPQPIGVYKLNRELTDKEIIFIKNQKVKPNIGNNTSIDSRILRNKVLINLRDFIETSLADYFKTVYSPKNKTSLQITQSWTNYTEAGQFHHKHTHSNSFISGIFYLQANREIDRIYFHRSGFQMIRLSPKEWNIWNSESWWFEVGTGDLILFPSHIPHMVETVRNEETRISLSFNTFPIGFLGEEDELASVKLTNTDIWGSDD